VIAKTHSAVTTLCCYQIAKELFANHCSATGCESPSRRLSPRCNDRLAGRRSQLSCGGFGIIGPPPPTFKRRESRIGKDSFLPSGRSPNASRRPRRRLLNETQTVASASAPVAAETKVLAESRRRRGWESEWLKARTRRMSRGSAAGSECTGCNGHRFESRYPRALRSPVTSRFRNLAEFLSSTSPFLTYRFHDGRYAPIGARPPARLFGTSFRPLAFRPLVANQPCQQTAKRTSSAP
jgi:hypothetical protein